MTLENYGFFHGNSEHASLVVVARFEMENYPLFPEMISSLERLIKEELYQDECVFVALAEDMARDEEEVEHEYYNVAPVEVAEAATPLLLPVEPEAALLMLAPEFGREFACEVDPIALVKLYRESVSASECFEEANAAIAEGAAVYSCRPNVATVVALTPQAFNAGWMDARQVLLAEEVDPASVNGKVEVYPMPPQLHKKSGKYWGQFKGSEGGHMSFIGPTQKDVKLKLAVAVAWDKKFGV